MSSRWSGETDAMFATCALLSGLQRIYRASTLRSVSIWAVVRRGRCTHNVTAGNDVLFPPAQAQDMKAVSRSHKMLRQQISCVQSSSLENLVRADVTAATLVLFRRKSNCLSTCLRDIRRSILSDVQIGSARSTIEEGQMSQYKTVHFDCKDVVVAVS